MTSQTRVPEEMSPVEIRLAVVRHTYGCPRCVALGRICIKGRRLRWALEAGEHPPKRRVNRGRG